MLDMMWFTVSMVALFVGAGLGYYQGFRDGEGGSNGD